jgi:hypothetical protein
LSFVKATRRKRSNGRNHHPGRTAQGAAGATGNNVTAMSLELLAAYMGFCATVYAAIVEASRRGYKR